MTYEHPSTVAVDQSRTAILGTLQPVKPLPSDKVIVSVLFIIVAFVGLFGAFKLGPNGWEALSNLQRGCIFLCLAAGGALLALSVTRQMVPGSRVFLPAPTVWGLALVPTLLAFSLLFPWNLNYKGRFIATGMPCMKNGLLYATIAAVLSWFFVRLGAWESRWAGGAITGLMAGFAGLMVNEVHCPRLEAAHVTVWHFGALVVCAVSGALAGRIALHSR